MKGRVIDHNREVKVHLTPKILTKSKNFCTDSEKKIGVRCTLTLWVPTTHISGS